MAAKVSAVAVVTIARLIGARAHEVGELVATGLSAELIDRHLIDEVARRLQVPVAAVEELDEVPSSRLDRLLEQFASSSFELAVAGSPERWEPPFGGDPTLRNPKQATVRVTDAVIRQLIRRGDAVIMGRGAAYVARAHPRAVRAFLWAATDRRIAEVRTAQQIDEAQAARRVKETDANWRSYVKHFYGADLMDPANYDLVIDTGRVPPPAAAGVIIAAARFMPPD
jgi:cytidylate kinase